MNALVNLCSRLGATTLRFRWKLALAMMLLTFVLTAIGVVLAHRHVAQVAQRELRQALTAEIAAWSQAQAVRQAALVEHCRVLVRKPRLHAALEDDALDLLYLSARDELRDIVAPTEIVPATALRAQFYRFLNAAGEIIPAPADSGAGRLAPEEERQLRLAALPDRLQLGYLVRSASLPAESPWVELIAVPIRSMETQEPIAALVLGFTPAGYGTPTASLEMLRALRIRQTLHGAPLRMLRAIG